MSSISRVLSTPCSSSTFQCVKSANVLANRTSQGDRPKHYHEEFAHYSGQIELEPRVFIKNPADFCIHPEKLKQIIKEKDGQIICNFLSREGYKKRKRCLMIIEKKRKLLQATGIGTSERPYIVRNMSMMNKPSHQDFYPSYVNLKEEFMPSISKKQNNREMSETDSLDSVEAPKSKSKEIFFNLNRKEDCNRSSKKKKRLKPLQVFKRTRHLSKSCEMNMPPLLVKETNTSSWVVPSDSDQDSIIDVFIKRKNEANRDQIFASEPSANDKTLLTDRIEKNKVFFKKKSMENDFLIDNVFTLFDKVKLGSQRKSPNEIKTGDTTSFKSGIHSSRPLSADQIDPYKIISSTLKRKEMHLRRQFSQMAMSNKATKKDNGKLASSLSKKDAMIREMTSKLSDFYEVCKSKVAPTTATATLRRRGFRSYLVRLPKTTPEGYRVLLYAVRDNDPTKMNFSDCIKGFCMYNDCVLSEDGLQEGYIVIFDMKGVQLGHLARVSLPALRCFMMYIQEAHPCRLKAIHILNTASWIHHVMRLIVPLVRNDLLSLVQFHKGNTPEGIPLELLPSNYGGEAPSMEDLDKDTKSMVDKYREWLLETVEWKSDESKRVKKASWWGFFNGTNKTNNVELDEKTILRNLQID